MINSIYKIMSNKNILRVIGDKLFYNESIYTVDDLFSREFYEYSDQKADEFLLGEITENVVYMSYIQPVLAIEHFIRKNEITDILFEKVKYSTWVLVSEAANLCGIKLGKKFGFKRSVNRIIQRAILLGSRYYLLVTQLQTKHIKRSVDLTKDVCVIRSTAARKKIKPDGTKEFFFEDRIGKGDLYAMFPLRVRRETLKKAYRHGIKHHKFLRKKLCDMHLEQVRELVLDFYAKRLVHTYFYGFCIEKLLELPWEGKYITGNNLDAYALLEERVAHNANMEIICIPHGLEYGFKVPHRFVGDCFYATSEYASNYLNNLYKCDNFVFDKAMAERMFSLKYQNKQEKRVVYFSEPRESNVNMEILEELYAGLVAEGIPLYIKHHPKDIKEEYKRFEKTVAEIEDLAEAVTGNICIARKSTVLLEALYNNSESAAIVVNVKDDAIFNTFPSLQDERISRFEKVSELVEWIKDCYNN